LPIPEERRISAEPTKEFFISMLVKDIELPRAIIDLVDNSLDGARRIRPEGDFEGLFIRVEASPKYFKITDNCGGIPVEMARKYAFRFGRPQEMKPTPHSVGQFGVGMKRALFKLGKAFSVESTTRRSRFVVSEDVEVWKNKKEWEYELKELEEGLNVPSDRTGTTIIVKPLHLSIAAEFELESFQTRLANQIAEAHAESMGRGLGITLGKLPLKFRPLDLLQSDRLGPAYQEMSFGTGRSRVEVKIYAGISESKPSEAGWYIFCNGRLVLGADQSLTTGWGEGGEQTIPKYHNQYARFRGYAVFDSDDASKLPWKTTKTGVDADSPSFRAVRLKMITLMRPVIDFLNRLDAEKDREAGDPKPLAAAVNQAKPVVLEDVRSRPTFLAPKPLVVPRGPEMGRIQYSKPLEQIKRVRRQLKAKSYKEIGEKTFEYYLKMECSD